METKRDNKGGRIKLEEKDNINTVQAISWL